MKSKVDAVWAQHDAEWRDTAQVTSLWEEARSVAPESLRYRTRGRFSAVLDELRATLLVTREYEHLVVALSVEDGRPRLTYLRLPHPSGLVYDQKRRRLHIAATRNPNQILELAPVASAKRRSDMGSFSSERRPLVPVSSRFYPGCTYLHDLALVGGSLHANAVGENAVVRVEPDGRLSRVWWPRCIERGGRPRFEQNYLQLNSIAAGPSIEDSFFSASTDTISRRRPGHRNFGVQGRGVVFFSGKSREAVARGLTRPHSARLNRGRIWVANSGYGELGVIQGSGFEPLVRLRGWTRASVFPKGSRSWERHA